MVRILYRYKGNFYERMQNKSSTSQWVEFIFKFLFVSATSDFRSFVLRHILIKKLRFPSQSCIV